LGDARATTVSRNRIFSFPSTSGSTGTLIGIEFKGSSGNAAAVTLNNNQISIVPSFNNSQTIYGLRDDGFTGNTFTANYNSIFIGGTATGSATWAYSRATVTPTTVTLKDNIFFNNRTGGTVNHFAAGDASANTGAFVSDFNFFVGTGTTAANFMDYGTSSTGTAVSFTSWKAGPPTRDANSTGSTAASFTVSNIFVDVANGDLHLKTTAPASIQNAGTTVAGITTDFDNDTRDGTTPDIGADEVTTMQFSLAAYTVAENVVGGLATITVTRTAGTGSAATVNYATSDGSATTAGNDYTSASGTLNFAAGDTSKTFTISINDDAVFEGNETVNITLSAAAGGSIIGSPSAAVLTITDNETQPTISINSVSVSEAGGNAVFTVTQSGLSAFNTTFTYSTADGSATAGSDYTGASNVGGSIAAGSTTTTISIPILQDTIYEGNETFTVTLSNPVNATIATGTGTGTIIDDETAPSISIGNVTVGEGGGNAVFTVTQSAVTAVTTTFTYSTTNGTAVAPNDYTAASNVAGSITAGMTSTTISIPVIQDALTEGDENFFVTISNPVNATIGTATGTGTITDDDLTFNASGNLAAGTYDNVTINSPAVVTLTGNITVNGCITVNNGSTLLMGTFVISGTGCFTVNAGGTLGVGSVNGITTSGASGNVQVTGTRTYTVGANYIYNGTSAQVTGNALSNAPNNLTLNNPTSVTSSITGLTVTGLLEVVQGTFNSASNYNNVQIDSGATFAAASGETINVSGNWTNNGGTFTAGSSTVNFNSTTSTQTIGGTSGSQTFNILTVSKSGQTLSTGGSLATLNIATFNVNAGTFDQGATDVFSGPLTVAASAIYQGLSTGDLTLSGGVTNSGTITLSANGSTCGDADDILIRSSVNGTQRAWSGTGTFNLSDVDVKDQAGTAAILVRNGTNSGNNGANWIFFANCTGAAYTWAPVLLATDYQVPTNWSPTRLVPDPGDVLTVNGDNTPSPLIANVPTQTIASLRLTNFANVTLNASTITPPYTLTLSGASGNDLAVPSGTSLTLAGANVLKLNVASGSTGIVGGQMIVQDAAHRLLGNAANAITFQSGSFFTTSTGFTGNAFGSGAGGDGVAGSVNFASGSIYSHNAGGSPFGASGNPSVVTFQTGSVARYFVASGFDASGRTYANLEIGDSNGAVVATQTGSGANQDFQFDNLTVNSTGSATSSLNYSGTGTITIQGNITSTGTGSGAASDVTLAGGSGGIVLNKAGTQTFSGGNGRTITFGSNATVNNGTTLALSRNLITSGTNVLTLSATGNISGGAGGYVIGSVKKISVPGSFIFPVGVAAITGYVGGYTPLDLANASGGGDLTVTTNHAVRPTLDTSKTLNEYWTLTKAGTLTSDLTFHYLDTDANGTDANYRLIVVEGGNATAFPNSCPSSPCVNTTANTITRTGVQTFSDWTAGAPSAPSAVKLTGFAAVQTNGEVALQWQTGYETRNLGYIVYREQDGKRVQITPSLVAGSALIAGNQTKLTAGLNYTWYDQVPTADGRGQTAAVGGQRSAVTYWLEDVDLDGTRTLHGPITPWINYGGVKQSNPRADLISEVSRRTPAGGVQINSWPVTAGEAAAPDQAATNDSGTNPIDVQRQIAGLPGVKISVSRAGWYRITQPEIVAAGLDVADSKYLQLYRDGRPVALRFSDWKDEFMEDGYLEFYGEGPNSTTDKAQTYYLVKGAEPGKRTPVIGLARLGEPSGPQSFAYTVERKERMVYFSGLLNGDQENFFGQILSNAPTTATVPVVQLDPATNDGQLEVVVQGVTNQSHLVQVRFNGVDLGTINFANTAHPSQTFSVPAAALREGNNSVELTTLGGAADISLVDSLRLTYQRTYTAANEALIFSVNSDETKRVSGFTDDRIRIFDITDPASALELKALVGSDGEHFLADVQVPASANSPHTLVAVSEGQAAHVDGIVLNQQSSWWSQTAGADYLIITPRNLMSSVEPLAVLHRSQGMVVQVVDVEDLYDEFTFGEHSPRAIHDFLQRATTTWTRQPRYVLLAGDASYDPKNYFGQGLNDQVPTKLIDTTLNETASDDWLADFNNDGIADLAVGRLPLRSVTDMNTMVGKILNYENTAPDPTRGALLVADTGFGGQSTAVQGLLPAGMAVQTINRSSADDATIHNQIIAAINQGPLVTNYVGHGSNGVWTGASLLSNNDAPSLGNTNRLSVFTMMTCFNGFFQDAQNDSLSEALLKSQGGAVAVWASTTLTDPAGQNVIDQEFYRQLFGAQPATLGDAARSAKVTTTDADVRRTWTLFGDPAMRLH